MTFSLRAAAPRRPAGEGLLPPAQRAAASQRTAVVARPLRCNTCTASPGRSELNGSSANLFLEPWPTGASVPGAEREGADPYRRARRRSQLQPQSPIAQEPIRQLVIFEDLAEQLLGKHHIVRLPAAEAVELVNFTNKNIDRLVSKLGKSRKLWRRVLVLHEWLLLVGHQPDNRLCTTIMHLCNFNGEPLRSLALYDWMQGMQAMGTPGPRPNVYTYTTAMRAALLARQPRKAIQIFQDSRENGCSVDTHLLCTAIEAHVRGGNADAALQMFEHYRELVKPSLQMYNVAMRAATLDNRGERALELWEELQSRGVTPSLQTYTTAISACAALQDSEHAYLLYRQAIDSGLRADCRILTALIAALGSEYQWQRATKVLQYMLRNGITPSVYTYSAVISTMVICGELNSALRMLYKMQIPAWGGVQPNAYIYSQLIKGLGRRGRFGDVKELFSSALEQAGLDEMYRHCQAVASSRQPGGDSDGDAFRSDPSELGCALAHAQAEAHHEPEADADAKPQPRPHWVEAAAGGEVPSHRQLLVNEVVVGAMLSACERCGEWEEALALLRWVTSGSVPGVRTNTVMLNATLSALGKSGKWEEAQKEFEAHRGICDRVSLETMVATYGLAGQVREAELMLREIIEGGEAPRDYAFCGIIAAYKATSSPRRALQVRHRMRSLNVPPSVHVYNELLALCERYEMWDKALELSQAMKREEVPPNRTTHDLLAIIGERGKQNVEEQQAAAAAWSAAAYFAGTLLLRTGVM
mmetsp:Transcript_8498/g.24365  ORF Transcript_8498/g.24365 Transcript_8498/m.24365 type:complete len:757 (-) Transcript_8498:177-2447(-)